MDKFLQMINWLIIKCHHHFIDVTDMMMAFYYFFTLNVLK